MTITLDDARKFAPSIRFHQNEQYFPCSIKTLLRNSTLKSSLLFTRWQSDDMGEGPGAVAWLSGDVNGNGWDEVIQLWANGSVLGAIVYGRGSNDAEGVLSKLWRTDNLGAGPNAVAWRMADLNHDGKAEIIQLWDNNGALGITVFGMDASGALRILTSSTNMGAGSGAVSWQVGDINNDGKAEIIQLWDNNGALGITVYGMDASGALRILTSATNTGAGSGAISYHVGDTNGDGKPEIIQLWDNHGVLGITVFGMDAGAIHIVSSATNAGGGSGAVSYLVGDINGDRKAEVVQLWNNHDRLGITVFGSVSGGPMSVLTSSVDMGQGPGAVSWQLADVNGDGKPEIIQLWANGNSLGIIVYGVDARGALTQLWCTEDAGQGPGAVAWLRGRFAGNGFTGLVQLWNHGSRLGMIHYDGGPEALNRVDPSPEDLGRNWTPNVWLDINPANYGGERNAQGQVTAPLYYCVQEDTAAATVKIHYLMLYAYQGGQTCRALRAGTEFNCIVNTYGVHQGDLERVTVELAVGSGGSLTVSRVHFEAHGDLHSYTPDQVTFEGGTHPLVHVALMGHSCWNMHMEGDRHSETRQDGFVDVASFVNSDGVSWKPYEGGTLIQLGLDGSKNALYGQPWARFEGRLGRYQRNSMSSATYFDGSNLKSEDWSFVKIVNWAALQLNKIAEDKTVGNGPEGPGAREYMRPSVRR